ncbi:MAG TPA: MAPEG family protein [Roseiarcus sp.]|nr:MAPEG family protein [Roseiarcus sp.]
MHTWELFALELSVLLFIAHVLVQATFARGEFGDAYLLSPRDEQKAVKGTIAARAERALRNFTENYAAFVAVDLGLIATGQTAGWGAMVWVLGRIAYFAAYLAGIPVLRTACWAVSIVGLLMMLWRLAGL